MALIFRTMSSLRLVHYEPFIVSSWCIFLFVNVRWIVLKLNRLQTLENSNIKIKVVWKELLLLWLKQRSGGQILLSALYFSQAARKPDSQPCNLLFSRYWRWSSLESPTFYPTSMRASMPLRKFDFAAKSVEEVLSNSFDWCNSNSLSWE